MFGVYGKKIVGKLGFVKSGASLATVWRRLKLLLSLLVAALGFIVGLWIGSRLISGISSYGIFSESLWLRSITCAGFVLLRVAFLAGSLTALREPKRGGVIFLALLPFAAFCLAYFDVATRTRPTDSAYAFDLRLLLATAGLTTLFYIPILVPLFLWRDRKRATTAFVAGASIATFAFARFEWTSVLLPDLGVASGLLGSFGLFWLGTYKLGWPALIQARPHRRGVRRLANAVTASFVVLCACVVTAVATSAYSSSLFSLHCGARQPFTHASSDEHAVFTARAVYVGLSLPTRLQERNLPEAIHDSRIGEWAIGVVQDRFWGIPNRWPHVVLMTNFVFWKGETYFIDGYRLRNILGILPVIEGQVGCSRSRPVQDAIIDMRILHEAPLRRPAIVGYVRQPGPYNSMMTSPVTSKFLSGAQIDVTGPGGSTTAHTDASGIYQLEALPAGEYTVELHVPEGQTVGRVSFDRSVRKLRLKSEDLVEESFDLMEKGAGKP